MYPRESTNKVTCIKKLELQSHGLITTDIYCQGHAQLKMAVWCHHCFSDTLELRPRELVTSVKSDFSIRREKVSGARH